MNINKPITSALLALGLISSASVAFADTTEQIPAGTGPSYNEVFLTGSSAARANIFNAVTSGAGVAAGAVFDAAPTVVPNTATTGTSNYTAYGTINGVNYCLCMSFTGSEAGLWAIQHNAAGLPDEGFSATVNVERHTLGTTPASNLSGTAPNDGEIPGTPLSSSFVDPNTGSAFSAAPDLSMADTSQAVSLSQSPALVDYGIMGAVTFEWVKGKNSAPDQSYNDLTNVTDPELNYLLGGSLAASYFTANPSDTDLIYVVGRNRASGTHQNTMIDTQHGTTKAVVQYAPSDCTYNAAGQLTLGSGTSLTAAGGISDIFNDGFDSGGNVAGVLKYDEAGNQNVTKLGTVVSSGKNLIMIGYISPSDAASAITAGAKALTLNGNALNDANVINGSYSMWGHEHLYGEVTEDAAVQEVANDLSGANVNTGGAIEGFGGAAPTAGAIYLQGGLGGGEGYPASTTTVSAIIAPQYMNADKPSGSDSGYPSQL